VPRDASVGSSRQQEPSVPSSESSESSGRVNEVRVGAVTIGLVERCTVGGGGVGDHSSLLELHSSCRLS
jgi:hypothetical protein